jgi:hypothetical protein
MSDSNASSDPNSQNPYASKPQVAPPVVSTPGPPQQGDATGGVIPYKNPKALIAYYLGILSGLPVIGLPIGIAAFTLGIMGLKARKQNPAIKGSLHAAIGIGCGGFFALFWGLTIVGIVLAWTAKR